ncbi:hypothetical protein GUITHDRAFT_121220 [Guillardia theta CCMP2712]|uniref:WW domain-containing protein n=1 Tax=Guillardia theta (strain CCMP2712) TaxID=905079 RepID=L1I908_GUITC|nr:hypothetical protein GUITHDRAFT_121220 [Guillardia theta CCMP2712]EKX32592.1 hypothetical protein GUITHDRAFT_121220 [Guillardia theta CCMP2712]|eukprot:XP_005819572.1 hypothetical protein GUITHDRAFT_121220 [Guillardia theta CCMP2712]
MLATRTKLQRGFLITLALLVCILVLQRISSPAASNHAVEESQQKLLFGVPESYQSETVHRNPIRSSDTLGEALPPVAREVEPPGYFQFDGSLKHDKGTTLNLESPSSRPAVTSPKKVKQAPKRRNNEPVGVHEVDTPEGKVIYYPYIPKDLGPYMKAEGEVSNKGTQPQLAFGNDQIAAVLQQPSGEWIAPSGNYKQLSQALQSATNSQDLQRLESDFESLKEEQKKRIQRMKDKLWDEHEKFRRLNGQVEDMRVQLRELGYKWRNGPWPDRGPPGPPGPPGHKGKVITVREVVHKGDNPKMLQTLVKKDVDAFLESHVAKELKQEGQKLKLMEQANKRLLQKMKEASKGRWTFSKEDKNLVLHPIRTVKEQIEKYMKSSRKLRKLPAGWKREEDRNGRIYYINHKLHKSSWTFPSSDIVHKHSK